MRFWAWIPVAALVAVALVAAGCGGSSSKPKYCSARSDLQSAVSGLGGINPLSSGGLQKLQSQLQKIQSSAQDLQSSAKSDFPDQVNALESSATKLKGAVGGLSSNPTPAQVAGVAGDIKSLVGAAKDFTSAAASKCD
jgi:hypothetical protein